MNHSGRDRRRHLPDLDMGPRGGAPTASPSTSSSSSPTSRCCSTPGPAACSRWWPRRWPRSPGRVAALDQLRPRRGRRVRGDEHVARGRARQPGRVRRPRLRDLAQRHVRPAAAPLRRARCSTSAASASAPDLHPARPPRLGGPGALRGDDGHAAVRRPVDPGRRRPGADDRRRRRAAIAPRPCSTPRASRPQTAQTLRTLGDLEPTTLAIMHGPSFRGDGEQALYDLAAGYETRIAA